MDTERGQRSSTDSAKGHLSDLRHHQRRGEKTLEKILPKVCLLLLSPSNAGDSGWSVQLQTGRRAVQSVRPAWQVCSVPVQVPNRWVRTIGTHDSLSRL